MRRRGTGQRAQMVLLILCSILAYQIFLVFVSYSHLNLILTFVNLGLIALIYFLTC